MFKSISSFVAQLKPGYQEEVCKQKLAQLFQKNNRLLDKDTGRIYTVFDVTFGSALMIDAFDNVLSANWLNSMGRLKFYVADKFELVPA